MRSPLGLKLVALGYPSLWAFVEQHGFTSVDDFKAQIDFPSLAPVGFYDFLTACAQQDSRWNLAFRLAAADLLNNARVSYAVTSPSPDWMVIQPVSKLALLGDEVAWARPLAFTMLDYLLEHRTLFNEPFQYNDPWLVALVAGHE